MRIFVVIELFKLLGFLGVLLLNLLVWFGVCILFISVYYIIIKKISNEYLEKEYYEDDNEIGICSCVNK